MWVWLALAVLCFVASCIRDEDARNENHMIGYLCLMYLAMILEAVR